MGDLEKALKRARGQAGGLQGNIDNAIGIDTSTMFPQAQQETTPSIFNQGLQAEQPVDTINYGNNQAVVPNTQYAPDPMDVQQPVNKLQEKKDRLFGGMTPEMQAANNALDKQIQEQMALLSNPSAKQTSNSIFGSKDFGVKPEESMDIVDKGIYAAKTFGDVWGTGMTNLAEAGANVLNYGTNKVRGKFNNTGAEDSKDYDSYTKAKGKLAEAMSTMNDRSFANDEKEKTLQGWSNLQAKGKIPEKDLMAGARRALYDPDTLAEVNRQRKFYGKDPLEDDAIKHMDKLDKDTIGSLAYHAEKASLNNLDKQIVKSKKEKANKENSSWIDRSNYRGASLGDSIDFHTQGRKVLDAVGLKSDMPDNTKEVFNRAGDDTVLLGKIIDDVLHGRDYSETIKNADNAGKLGEAISNLTEKDLIYLGANGAAQLATMGMAGKVGGVIGKSFGAGAGKAIGGGKAGAVVKKVSKDAGSIAALSATEYNDAMNAGLGNLRKSGIDHITKKEESVLRNSVLASSIVDGVFDKLMLGFKGATGASKVAPKSARMKEFASKLYASNRPLLGSLGSQTAVKGAIKGTASYAVDGAKEIGKATLKTGWDVGKAASTTGLKEALKGTSKVGAEAIQESYQEGLGIFMASAIKQNRENNTEINGADLIKNFSSYVDNMDDNDYNEFIMSVGAGAVMGPVTKATQISTSAVKNKVAPYKDAVTRNNKDNERRQLNIDDGAKIQTDIDSKAESITEIGSEIKDLETELSTETDPESIKELRLELKGKKNELKLTKDDHTRLGRKKAIYDDRFQEGVDTDPQYNDIVDSGSEVHNQKKEALANQEVDLSNDETLKAKNDGLEAMNGSLDTMNKELEHLQEIYNDETTSNSEKKKLKGQILDQQYKIEMHENKITEHSKSIDDYIEPKNKASRDENLKIHSEQDATRSQINNEITSARTELKQAIKDGNKNKIKALKTRMKKLKDMNKFHNKLSSIEKSRDDHFGENKIAKKVKEVLPEGKMSSIAKRALVKKVGKDRAKKIIKGKNLLAKLSKKIGSGTKKVGNFTRLNQGFKALAEPYKINVDDHNEFNEKIYQAAKKGDINIDIERHMTKRGIIGNIAQIEKEIRRQADNAQKEQQKQAEEAVKTATVASEDMDKIDSIFKEYNIETNLEVNKFIEGLDDAEMQLTEEEGDLIDDLVNNLIQMDGAKGQTVDKLLKELKDLINSHINGNAQERSDSIPDTDDLEDISGSDKESKDEEQIDDPLSGGYNNKDKARNQENTTKGIGMRAEELEIILNGGKTAHSIEKAILSIFYMENKQGELNYILDGLKNNLINPDELKYVSVLRGGEESYPVAYHLTNDLIKSLESDLREVNDFLEKNKDNIETYLKDNISLDIKRRDFDVQFISKDEAEVINDSNREYKAKKSNKNKEDKSDTLSGPTNMGEMKIVEDYTIDSFISKLTTLGANKKTIDFFSEKKLDTIQDLKEEIDKYTKKSNKDYKGNHQRVKNAFNAVLARLSKEDKNKYYSAKEVKDYAALVDDGKAFNTNVVGLGIYDTRTESLYSKDFKEDIKTAKAEQAQSGKEPRDYHNSEIASLEVKGKKITGTDQTSNNAKAKILKQMNIHKTILSNIERDSNRANKSDIADKLDKEFAYKFEKSGKEYLDDSLTVQRKVNEIIGEFKENSGYTDEATYLRDELELESTDILRAQALLKRLKYIESTSDNKAPMFKKNTYMDSLKNNYEDDYKHKKSNTSFNMDDDFKNKVDEKTSIEDLEKLIYEIKDNEDGDTNLELNYIINAINSMITDELITDINIEQGFLGKSTKDALYKELKIDRVETNEKKALSVGWLYAIDFNSNLKEKQDLSEAIDAEITKLNSQIINSEEYKRFKENKSKKKTKPKRTNRSGKKVVISKPILSNDIIELGKQMKALEKLKDMVISHNKDIKVTDEEKNLSNKEFEDLIKKLCK